jgi:hypothetical protein
MTMSEMRFVAKLHIFFEMEAFFLDSSGRVMPSVQLHKKIYSNWFYSYIV